MDIDFGKLIYAVGYYLSYQDRIGRDFMINESSLKYPVADYLTALEIPIRQIKLEYPHPKLRRRLIDLVITAADPNDHLEMAFEFKIAGENTKNETERQRVFNDLMRLHLVRNGGKTSCYLLITGRYEDFIQSFRSIPTVRPTHNSRDLPEPSGFYSEWFGFKVNESRTFMVRNQDRDEYRNIYAAFLADYLAKESVEILELPEKITTQCVSITAISSESPTPYLAGIWKVE